MTLNYPLTVSPVAPAGMRAFDIDIETEDVSLKAKQSAVVLSMTSESAKALAALDDEIAATAQAVRNAKQKRDFLLQFSEDPAKFVETWLASQSRDLEVILGNDHGVKDEDLKRSDFFRLPWVRTHLHELPRADLCRRLRRRLQSRKASAWQMRCSPPARVNAMYRFLT